MTLARPFPGIAFRVETPTAVDLPRMDVCAFVGFAQRGPIHVPVVIESYPDFVDLFGGDYSLAWDGEANLWQTACLPTAVKAFFTQGGRRCWVVRVASAEAAVNTFPLSGLLQTTLSGYENVLASARCPGSWADSIESRVDFLVTARAFSPLLLDPSTADSIELQLSDRQSLQAGDLLQLDFSDRRHRAYGVVPTPNLLSTPIETGTQIYHLQPHWFHRITLDPLPLEGTVFTTLAPTQSSGATLSLSYDDSAQLEQDIIERATLSLKDTPTTEALIVEAGDWLRFETSTATLWLLVAAQTLTNELSIASVWAEGSDHTSGILALARVQQVQMALQARATQIETSLSPSLKDPLSSGFSLILSDLAGGASHPRFMGALPSDSELLAPKFGPQAIQTIDSELATEALYPRFPFSLKLPETTTIIPLGIGAEIPWRAGQVPTGNALKRDGLVPKSTDLETITATDWASFLPEIFLEPELRYTGARSLIAEANDRLYRRDAALSGIHSLIPLEDISIIAFPDAAHPGWRLTTQAKVTLPTSEEPKDPPDSCEKETPFIPCPLTKKENEDEGRSDSQEKESAEATLPTQWQMLSPSQIGYEAAGLLEIQQAAARLAAARGDWVALLSAPKHYRLPTLLDHQRQLLTAVRREGETTDSYLAMYYPWLISRSESGELIHAHPAGAISGTLAARSLSRGAWVAPANEPLTEAVATHPALNLTEEQALYAASINPIRRRANGFVAWGNYTLSTDPNLEDLNVRRLLILLRRLALREGQSYVFAPHSAAFRRRIQQQYEQVLGRLFDLGAFAGNERNQAYQVVIDGSLNTQAVVERGQLVIELRVAPSQPMTFITVRLIQTDNNQLALQEVINNGR